jgi:soluble lytic murein transglycosylase-like protein
MHNLGSSFGVVAVALALSAVASAQAPRTGSSADVFAPWNASASGAADRALAAALSERPWMKAVSRPSAVTAPPIALDPVGRLRAGLARVQQLRPIIDPILKQEGVPTELTAVALVESGGQPFALSPKGARGVWQFMPETARRYGLIVTAARDDRTDAGKSTRAAARYLRDLYRQFGDWRLAFAAYNAGEQRIGQALLRAGKASFENIERGLPQETRDYVPAVVNAMTLFGSSQFVLNGTGTTSSRARVVYASGSAIE